MEFLIALSYLLCIFIGALVAAVFSHYVFKKRSKTSERKRVLRNRQEKLDTCLEDLIEFNRSLGDMKGAISNFIAFGGEKYRDELEITQSKLLDAFKLFYRIDAYLLILDMQNTHKLMNLYIELISKLRSDFHFSSESLSMNDFNESVLKIKACRKRLFSSLTS